MAQYGTRNGEWRIYGADGGTRYSPLDQINRDNVKDLRVAWTWKSDSLGRPEINNETTPIMVNGVLYFTPATGGTSSQPMPGPAKRYGCGEWMRGSDTTRRREKIPPRRVLLDGRTRTSES